MYRLISLRSLWLLLLALQLHVTVTSYICIATAPKAPTVSSIATAPTVNSIATDPTVPTVSSIARAPTVNSIARAPTVPTVSSMLTYFYKCSYMQLFN